MGVFKLALLQFFLFSGLLHAAGQTDTDQNLYGKTVREIRIVQLQHTDRDIVTRELVSQVGEPYLQENTQKDLERLDRLGIFSESGETTWMTSMRRPPSWTCVWAATWGKTEEWVAVFTFCPWEVTLPV